MAPSDQRVSADALHALCCDCLAAQGIPPDDATAVADALLYATLRGLDTHGLGRLPLYMRRVAAGTTGSSERMTELAGEGAVRRLDAAQALGPAAGVRAADLAADLAHDYGIGLVSLGRATHFGAAGFYARRVTRRSLVAVVVSNGARVVAPHGAAERLLGTNPLAIALPLGRHGELVLDMSTSATTQAATRRAAQEERDLEPGVAIDEAGRPTLDPEAALAGSLLPFGGAKGSGLALVIALAAALLGAGALDDELPSIYRELDRPQDLGQVFFALDPSRLTEPVRTLPRLEAFVDRLHALAPAESHEGARLPGQAGDALARERVASGIPLGRGALESVAVGCDECGLPELAERARRLDRPGEASVPRS